MEKRLDAMMDKIGECRSVKIVLPDLEHVRAFPDMIKTEVDRLRTSLLEELKETMTDTLGISEGASLLHDIRELVARSKPLVAETEQAVHEMGKKFESAWSLTVASAVGLVVCLLLTLVTNLALLTTPRTLFVTIPVTMIVGLVIARSLLSRDLRTKSNAPASEYPT